MWHFYKDTSMSKANSQHIPRIPHFWPNFGFAVNNRVEGVEFRIRAAISDLYHRPWLSLSLEPVQIHPNSSKFIQNRPQTKVISPPIQNWPWQASNDQVWSWNQHLVNLSPSPWVKPHRCIFSNSKMSFGQTTKYSKSRAASSHLF